MSQEALASLKGLMLGQLTALASLKGLMLGQLTALASLKGLILGQSAEECYWGGVLSHRPFLCRRIVVHGY